MTRDRCSTCVEKAVPRPLFAAHSDGRCFNHSTTKEAVARRRLAGSRGGARGSDEAKRRQAKGIAGRGRGKGVAAAAAPEPEPPKPTPADAVPAIDFSSADSVTSTMERILVSLFTVQGVTCDTVKAAQAYCETAQKVRAPRGAGAVKSDKPPLRIIRFENVGEQDDGAPTEANSGDRPTR